MRATGIAGALRVGYQWAADLGAWEIAPDPDRPRAFLMRARLLTQHDYWMTQEPLDLALTLGAAEWLWRGVRIFRTGDEVRVILDELPIACDRAPLVR